MKTDRPLVNDKSLNIKPPMADKVVESGMPDSLVSSLRLQKKLTEQAMKSPNPSLQLKKIKEEEEAKASELAKAVLEGSAAHILDHSESKPSQFQLFWNNVNKYVDYALMIKQFTEGAQMSSQNEKKLEKFEPENDNRSWTRHLKPIFIGCVAIGVIL